MYAGIKDFEFRRPGPSNRPPRAFLLSDPASSPFGTGSSSLLQLCPFPYIEAYSTQLHHFASTEQNNSAFRLADYELIRIFAVSNVSPAMGGRENLYIRKTFSNVCRCALRISQIPQPQQTDDDEASSWCVYSISLCDVTISVLAWANCVVYPVWRGNARACRARMDTRTDTCAFFVYP